MGEVVLPPLLPVEKYSDTEGKLAASVRWLILRVFGQEKDIPDKLRNGMFRDEQGHLQVDTAVLAALTNGSMYCQAAAKIFKEPRLVTKSHGAVLAALTDYGIDVVMRPEAGGQPVTEQLLVSLESFHTLAHLAVMDALMQAHLFDVIQVERVVESVSRHTSVDERERPIDAADALLFWINKICLLMRDDVEREDVQLKGGESGGGGMIPEMEDLYDEISDGQCLCAMVAWYRPREMCIQDVCFNDPMSNPDCQYNLMLLQQFCEHCLPWSPFHFEVEDVLYLHDSMQMNINVFLADLFQIFEPPQIVPVQPEVAASPRRFVPIHTIPDLRAANVAARSPHPPRVRNLFHSVHVTQSPVRSMSVLSQDSLATNRTNDSWKANPTGHPPEHWGANVTNFGKLQQSETNGATLTGAYTRSDSLPAPSIKLALEEKRREHEKRKAMQSTLCESERAEKGKAAFFALMNRCDPNQSHTAGASSAEASVRNEMLAKFGEKLEDLENQVREMNMQTQTFGQKMSRALSQPSVYQDSMGMGVPPGSARAEYGTLPHPGAGIQPGYPQGYGQQQQQQQQQTPLHAPPDYYYQGGGQYAQPQLRSSLSNGMLNYVQPTPTPYDYHTMGHAPSHTQAGMYGMQPDPYSMYGQQPQQPQQHGFNLMQHSAHSNTGFALHGSSAGAGAPPPNGAYYPGDPSVMTSSPQYHQSPPHPIPGQELYPPQQMGENGGSPGSGFLLHNQDASSSRLDPPLEINRNLTNWGISYKQGHTGRPQRRTWENQTFIKSHQDLVNQPDLVPTVPSVQDHDYHQLQQPSSASRASSVVGSAMRARDSRETRDAREESEEQPDRENHRNVPDPVPVNQNSPPRDPGSNNTEGLDISKSTTAGGGQGFVVTDADQAADDFDKIAEQRRLAKRAALLAKTMKRKEEIDTKVDAIEKRNEERRQAEMAKRDMAEQKKIAKEIQRQKILDEYKRKKIEEEMGMEPSSARSTTGRGSSQPPFVRTKSQVSESTLSARGPGRSRGQSSVEPRQVVPSLQEPTHKVFVKPSVKTNRSLILNALNYSVFPGAVNEPTKMKTMKDMAASEAKHFLLLFRDNKCQYRGLYSWDQVSDTAVKISGQGPPKCQEVMMSIMFKYDSGAKSFSQIPTKHLSATIDGFAIKDEFWARPKIPHSTSGTATHRNN